MNTRRVQFAAALLTLLAVLLVGALTAAQTPPPPTATPFIIGPVTSVTLTPTFTPVPPDDPRPVVCSAPSQPGFRPHVVRPGDRLIDLLAGVDLLTLTQMAALNCLDDPAVLPVGGVIWLPPVRAWQVGEPGTAAVPRIIRLDASQPRVLNTNGVIFTWEAEGQAAYFYVCNPDPALDCPRPSEAQLVPLDYSTPPIAPFRYAGTYRYRLEVTGTVKRVTQDVMVEVVCQHGALPDTNRAYLCPDAPVEPLVEVVYQPFERGRLLSLADTGETWALLPDGRVEVVIDMLASDLTLVGSAEIVESDLTAEPLPTLVAPEGLFAPSAGFEPVWWLLGGEDVLGWATAPEYAGGIAYQPAGRVSYTTYYTLPNADRVAITFVPGQPAGWWSPVPPQRES